jgi:hypothetical protein
MGSWTGKGLTESFETAMSTLRRMVVVAKVKNTAKKIEKTETKSSLLKKPKPPSKIVYTFS